MDGTGIFVLMMPSIFGWLRAIQVDASIALVAHLIIIVPLFAITVIAIYKEKRFLQRSAMVILGTFAISPYALYYDLIPVSFVLGLLIWEEVRRDGVSITANLAIWSFTALAPIYIVKTSNLGIPAAQIAILGCLCGLCLNAIWPEKFTPATPAEARD